MDLEANLLEQMEEEFEDQLGDYVELVDPTNFDFQISTYVANLSFNVCRANLVYNVDDLDCMT